MIELLSASYSCAVDATGEAILIANHTPPVKYENVVETVIIDDIPYEVPEPWAGNRLFPTKRNLDELTQIPPEFALNSSEIYILAGAYESFIEMLAKAHEDGIELLAESAYRSINYQNRIFVRRMKQGHTFEETCRYVAPPGYSQHMLGTAIDFSPSDWSFAESPQYQWLQENGADFGFEETYSRNNRYHISWESWHWNYVGKRDEEAIVEVAQPTDNKVEIAEQISKEENLVQD